MSLNVPSNVSKIRSSYGPGVLYVGAAGTTPTTAIGLVGDDGASFEVSGEMIDIMQGNPRMIVESVFQSQMAILAISSLEWELTRMAYALGAGTTTVSASNETLVFGGEPQITKVALELQHRKCTASHTVNVRLWQAVSEGGQVGVAMNRGAPHRFPYRWKALRSTTNWAGATLDSAARLFEVDIELT